MRKPKHANRNCGRGGREVSPFHIIASLLRSEPVMTSVIDVFTKACSSPRVAGSCETLEDFPVVTQFVTLSPKGWAR